MNINTIQKQIEEFLKLSLSVPQSSDNDEEQVINSYLVAKGQLQEAVAMAFESVFKTELGQDTDYHCDIMMIPEALNKEPI